MRIPSTPRVRKSTGEIDADDEAIFAQGPGNIEVISKGDITPTTFRGIFANADIPGPFGTVFVKSDDIIKRVRGDLRAGSESWR